VNQIQATKMICATKIGLIAESPSPDRKLFAGMT
jgi:hypothetical protein